jgi:hypothetical protein
MTAPTTTLIAAGASFRFCGYDYVIGHLEPDKHTRQPARFHAVRRPECGDGSTPFRYIRGNVADLRDSGAGWLYLPQMVRGKLRPRLAHAVREGTVPAGLADAVARAIQAHPAYLLGRDDQAEDAILPAFGLKALPEAPWPSRLPEGELPPRREAGAVQEQLERAAAARANDVNAQEG